MVYSINDVLRYLFENLTFTVRHELTAAAGEGPGSPFMQGAFPF